MASKGAKESIANKLGFKSLGQKSVETELEKVKKENAQLKKTLEETSRLNGKHQLTSHDSDKAKLMERIVVLETLREKNNQQLLAKEQEIVSLRQQLGSKGGEVVSTLQNQLEQNRKEAEQRDREFLAFSQEAEELKTKLVTTTQRCQALEKHSVDSRDVPGEIGVVQEKLRDALEKNQHWLVYDQQREAYVQGIFARMTALEQQLNEAKQAFQQSHKEANSEDQPSPGITWQDHERAIQEIQRELECQRELNGRLQVELEDLRVCCEKKGQQAAQMKETLLDEQRTSQQALAEERRLATERMARLQKELEVADARLEGERMKTAELLHQANLLQKSLLKQHEEQKRIAVLEQQIKISAKDFEKEKLDRQSLQHQLHKVLKELRKARDQITSLVSAKSQREASYPEQCYSRWDSEDHILTTTSQTKNYNVLDESFLECPNCRTSYPTSQHRELLMHLDYCFN